jgi:hypothetical protein
MVEELLYEPEQKDEKMQDQFQNLRDFHIADVLQIIGKFLPSSSFLVSLKFKCLSRRQN